MRQSGDQPAGFIGDDDPLVDAIAVRQPVEQRVPTTLGAAALVFGIVHSADAGWSAPTTIVALALGTVLVAAFVIGQAHAAQPLMPLFQVRLGID